MRRDCKASGQNKLSHHIKSTQGKDMVGVPTHDIEIVITPPKDDLPCHAKQAFRTIWWELLLYMPRAKQPTSLISASAVQHSVCLLLPWADIPHSRAATILVGFVQAFDLWAPCELWGSKWTCLPAPQAARISTSHGCDVQRRGCRPHAEFAKLLDVPLQLKKIAHKLGYSGTSQRPHPQEAS